MHVTLITDNDVVLWKVCYNSLSQDVLNFPAKIVTSCYTIQSMEWSDALVDTNDVCFNEYLAQHIGYQNKYCRGKSSRLEYYSKWLKYYFLIKISRTTPIVIEQVCLCFKMSLKACLQKVF